MNSLVYIQELLIILAYISKITTLIFIGRFIYYMDDTITKYNVCEYNLFYIAPVVFSSMAYLANITNWLSLSLSLKVQN